MKSPFTPQKKRVGSVKLAESANAPDVVDGTEPAYLMNKL